MTRIPLLRTGSRFTRMPGWQPDEQTLRACIAVLVAAKVPEDGDDDGYRAGWNDAHDEAVIAIRAIPTTGEQP